MTRSLLDTLIDEQPAADGPVAGLAAEMMDNLGARAAPHLDLVGAAGSGTALPGGIRSHFLHVLWQLLGSHVRDQGRIWGAGRPGGEGAVGGAGFAAYLRGEGWAALLDRLPSIGRLVSSVAAREVDATVTLLSRAAGDRRLLGARFGAGGDPGPLVEASLGLSDPHNGRQAVAALTFAGGLRVIYKPRPVAMEQGLWSVIDWLRGRAGLDIPAGGGVLERDGYGWCELVEWGPCARAEEVDLFYRRLGSLAGVLAGLAATDCHADNFVARGCEPVMVDAETLLHPRTLASPGFSVMETEILASQAAGPAGQRIDYAGFDAPASSARPGGPVPTNLPGWDGRVSCDHGAAFDAGLDATRRALRAVGDELTADDGPLLELSHRPARAVLRPTSVYGALLGHLLSAPALGSDDGGWPRVERELVRYQDPVLAPDVWRAVQAEEIAALARADVPYFLADTSTGDLFRGDGARLAVNAFRPVLAELPAVVRRIAGESLA